MHCVCFIFRITKTSHNICPKQPAYLTAVRSVYFNLEPDLTQLDSSIAIEPINAVLSHINAILSYILSIVSDHPTGAVTFIVRPVKKTLQRRSQFNHSEKDQFGVSRTTDCYHMKNVLGPSQ